MPTPKVTLQLPVVLKPVAGRERMEVQGHHIAEALEAAFTEIPLLRHHIALDSGELRPHVLVILNGTAVDRASIDQIPLASGDEILIHQAISGG